MINYLIRRFLLMIPTMIGITMVVFFTMALAPGDMTQSMMNMEGEVSSKDDQQRLQEQIRRKHHLDKNVFMRYLIWINNLSPVGFVDNGDGSFGDFTTKEPSLGRSIKGRDVSDMIVEAMPITIIMNLLSIPGTFALAVWSGILMGRKRQGLLDVGLGTTYLGLYSLPVIWVGVLAIGFLASAQYPHLQYFPSQTLGESVSESMRFLPHYQEGKLQPGYLAYTTWHLILPVLCMSYGGFAFLSKMMRTTVLESISSDFVRTAHAKGCSESTVLYRHVFRNSMIPLITITAGIMPALISGSVIVERIFSIDGMGKLALQATMDRDVYLVMATTLLGGVLGLLAILIADIGYAIADPRVSYE